MSKNQYKTINVYVDGFNFYYGVLRDRNECKWLDMHKFIRNLLPGVSTKVPYDDTSIIKIKYFTAKIKSLYLPPCGKSPGKRDQRYEETQRIKIARQKNYLKLLENEKNTEVIKGFHSMQFKEAPVPEVKRINSNNHENKDNLCYTGRTFQQRVVNEKGSDVNLAVRLIIDSSYNKQNAYGKWAVVISNDADLHSAIAAIQKHCKKCVLLINPHTKKNGNKSQLERIAQVSLRLHELQDLDNILKKSQFSDEKRLYKPNGRISVIKNPYI